MKVTVYTIPNCPKCSAAKVLLKRKDITYEEIDVTIDKATNQWAYDDNPQFPVVLIDGRKIEGFANLKEELK